MDSAVLSSNRKDCEMKPSHTQTPRTLADCTFTQGYTNIYPMAHREPAWERVAGYVLAKGFEHFDREILELTGVVSGHTLKHVAAGIAGLPVVWMLWKRELAVPVAHAPAPVRRFA